MSDKPHILIALSNCKRAVERAKTRPEYDRNRVYRETADEFDEIFLPWIKTNAGQNEKLIAEMLEKCIRDLHKPLEGHEYLRNSSSK